MSPRAARLEVPTAQRQPAPCSRGPPGTHASLGPRHCLHDAALVRGSRRKVRPAVLPRPLGREHCGVTETGHGRPLPGWARGTPQPGGGPGRDRDREAPTARPGIRAAETPAGRSFWAAVSTASPVPPSLRKRGGRLPDPSGGGLETAGAGGLCTSVSAGDVRRPREAPPIANNLILVTDWRSHYLGVSARSIYFAK